LINVPLIALIEDDPQLTLLLSTTLKGLDYSVVAAKTAKAGLDMIQEFNPGLLVLDLGLPDIDGQSLIPRIRQQNDLPIIILSARNQEQDITKALNNCADDYLTKPFNTSELVARINALLRRSFKIHENNREAVLTVGELKIEFSRRRVFIANQEIRLTPVEYGLLTTLAGNPGFVVTHRQLLLKVWGPNHVDHNHYLRVYMGHLRHKIESDPTQPKYLLTEPGVGYKLNVES
jgi:two-component system, OmpR family, KDP operon response regulator KdpE